MTYWKFQLFATMTASFQEAAKQQGSAGGAEMDEIKRMLVETNPWFLGLTAAVSILHVMYVSCHVWLPLDTYLGVQRLASRCWRLARTSHIGGRNRSSSEFLSGMFSALAYFVY